MNQNILKKIGGWLYACRAILTVEKEYKNKN